MKLYDDFNSPRNAIPWIENIDWSRQWSASHQIWGGIHCFSMSESCNESWLDVVFDWLNRNLVEQTYWWKKGVPHPDRHQPLGGSVYILPVYEHKDRNFPFPKQVIEYWKNGKEELLSMHPHRILASIGTFGLLQHHLPEMFYDDVKWTDIFSDRRFYRTDQVEVF